MNAKTVICASGLAVAAALLAAQPASATVTLLLAAGGGGGAGYSYFDGGDGLTTTSGGDGGNTGGGAGGVNGLGGAGGSHEYPHAIGENGGAGAGVLGNGGDGLYSRSGQGGFGPPTFAGGDGPNLYGHGGFGGGGGAGESGGGGGGGYSGGGGGGIVDGGGGGGGSYVASAFTGVTTTPADNGATGGGSGLDGYVNIVGPVGPSEISYTGSVIDYAIPVAGSYFIQAVGAQGGSGEVDLTSDAIGGYGALVSGDVNLGAGTILEILVGGGGAVGHTATMEHEVFSAGGGGGGTFIWAVTPIPEPSTWAMMLLGFAGLGLGCRKARALPAQAG